jgi:hypothetical protein
MALLPKQFSRLVQAIRQSLIDREVESRGTPDRRTGLNQEHILCWVGCLQLFFTPEEVA